MFFARARNVFSYEKIINFSLFLDMKISCCFQIFSIKFDDIKIKKKQRICHHPLKVNCCSLIGFKSYAWS